MTFVKVDLAAKYLFFLAANFKIHLNFFVCWTLVVKCCPAHKLMKNL
ncbi:unknown [Parabacteroides johnsonii CAG:246]|nr:unknown [Parabacteroides johnsonii CAG:246]